MVIVDTDSGPVTGITLGKARAWLGIPYAAPPIGPLRFRAPAPLAPWTAPRPAMSFGDAAPQLTPAQQRALPATPLATGLLSLLYPHSGSPVGGVPVGEDCLVLNVWSPPAGPPAPVMVWLHGGAFLHGAGSEPGFWGDRLAARHGVVVVTVNHRLGALGFFAGDDAAGGNAGMLDIVAALAWVRKNIAAFGGDPDNVTVFGQSGGGMKVSALFAMPAASGLFHKAVVMSGPGLRFPRTAEAQPLSDALVTTLGVASGDVEALRALPWNAIVDAQFAAMAMAPGVPGGWSPTVDGEHIVGDPLESAATAGSGIPLLTGATSEEAGMFLAMDPTYAGLDDAALASRIHTEFGAEAAATLATYRAAFPDLDAAGLLRRITTDRDVRVSVDRFAARKAEHGPAVFTYLFDYDSAVLDGLVGATHSGELAFVFDNADRVPLSGERDDRDALADAMAAAWAAFARTGDPSTPSLPWPALSTGGTMVFDGARPHVVHDPDGERVRAAASFPSRLFSRG